MTTDSPITPELLDQLLANYSKPEDLTGADGLFEQLKKALIERALGAELSEHLGYEKGDPAGRGSGNSRNGTSSKTVLTEAGERGCQIWKLTTHAEPPHPALRATFPASRRKEEMCESDSGLRRDDVKGMRQQRQIEGGRA